MSIRTDLAVEVREQRSSQGQKVDDGILLEERKSGEYTTITDVQIVSEKAAQELGKPKGRYITIENSNMDLRDMQEFFELSKVAAAELKKLMSDISPGETVLVVGLGNRSMTPDALGPKTIDKIMVTRHLHEYMPHQVDERLRPVCAISPGVLGVTGIESADMILSICGKIKPSLVIVIDALAARRSERIFSTIQISDSGIAPGAGIGNKRSALSKETLGVPVIAIGIPMVVYASTLVMDALEQSLKQAEPEQKNTSDETALPPLGEKLGEMVVTPKEIDVLIEDSSRILADALNMALHHDVTMEEVRAYMF